MKVSELMSHPARTCRVDDPCSSAAQLMWDGDCGCVPVTDEDGKLAGVVTDRDLCMAAYTTGRPLVAIPVGNAMSSPVRTCLPDEPIEKALETMGSWQLHRLPVVDATGALRGILSLADVVQSSANRGALAQPVAKTLAAITRSRRERTAETVTGKSAATETVVELPSTKATPAKSAPAKTPAKKAPRPKR